MKKIILFTLVAFTLQAQSQDSTKVKGLQIMCRQLEYVTPLLMNADNDSLYQVYIDLRPKFRISNPPSGNTLVMIDSIPTTELANLYNYTISNNEGIGYGNAFKQTIASARATNTYLDRLCTEYENFWQNRLQALRAAGRKLLRGK